MLSNQHSSAQWSSLSTPSGSWSESNQNEFDELTSIIRVKLRRAMAQGASVTDRLTEKLLHLLGEPITEFAQRSRRERERVIARLVNDVRSAREDVRSRRQAARFETREIDLNATIAR